jgi:hypothetical protein
MKKLLLLLVFIYPCFHVQAQYFQTGQDPASIRWRQIHTRNFQLIYPDYYEVQARKLAGDLDAIFPHASFTLKHNPRKIPVVLHTQTVESNGLVAWAPKRAELYTIPHQAIYPQDWLQQLALHEFRHVVQVDKLHSNLPRPVKWLLGEQGTGLAFGLFLPWWFIEGDAVVTETSLSNFGRGRLPSFLMEHQAQVVEKGVYTYDKAFFRSYRDFVPNHYRLGYYLAGNIRARHGAEIWENVLTRAGSKPWTLFPMNQVLKEKTGLDISQSYYSVFDSLKHVWVTEDKKYESADSEFITGRHKYFTSYTNPHLTNHSEVLSYKTAFDEIPSFVKISSDGSEHKVFFPGTIFNESINYNNEWIVWSEQIRDLRWQHSGRSLIRMFNAITERLVEFETEFKSFSPSFSSDLKKIAVVEADFSNNYYLSVYSLPYGKLLNRFQSEQNNYLFSPEWLNESQVVTVALFTYGKRLVRIDFDTHEMDILLDREMGDIKQLRVAADFVYFISSYSGKNSLYRLDRRTGSVEMVYEPRFDAAFPSVSSDGKSILLSDFTADGYRLIEIKADHEKILPLDKTEKGVYPLAEALAQQEAGMPQFSDTAAGTYISEEYSKTKNLFNIHSWAPAYVDVQSYEFFPGFSVMSQNVLGTSETIFGYKWDLAESTGRFSLEHSYKGWYPVFDFNATYGQRANEYFLISQMTGNHGSVISADTTLQRYTYGESTSQLKVRLPLSFNKGPYSRLIQPELQYGFNYIHHRQSTPERFHKGSFHYFGSRLLMYQLRRQSYMDVYPDFGIVVDGMFRYTPVGDQRAGHLAALQGVAYLPGILKNHGVKIYAGAQEKQTPGTVGFGDVIRYARGWGRINTTGIATGGFDYKLPLLYPDFNFWKLLYARRVTASLFADNTRLKGNFYSQGEVIGTFTKDINSFGTEFTADVNMVRFYAPATIGFRASYLPEMKDVYFNFLFSVDFTSF